MKPTAKCQRQCCRRRGVASVGCLARRRNTVPRRARRPRPGNRRPAGRPALKFLLRGSGVGGRLTRPARAVRLTLLPAKNVWGVSDGLAPLAATAVLFPHRCCCFYIRHVISTNLAAGTPNCSGWEGRLSGAGRGGARGHFFVGGGHAQPLQSVEVSLAVLGSKDLGVGWAETHSLSGTVSFGQWGACKNREK